MLVFNNTDLDFNPNLFVTSGDIGKIQSELQVITYLTGYCCYIGLKKIKCETFKTNLVHTEELVLEDKYSLTIILYSPLKPRMN